MFKSSKRQTYMNPPATGAGLRRNALIIGAFLLLSLGAPGARADTTYTYWRLNSHQSPLCIEDAPVVPFESIRGSAPEQACRVLVSGVCSYVGQTVHNPASISCMAV